LPSGYKFVIADDHPLFRGALKQALAGVGDVAAILEAGDFDSAKALVAGNDDIDPCCSISPCRALPASPA
jgi:DNA-binding NarL/FixJ family response regulator